jgi:hypothetical protein
LSRWRAYRRSADRHSSPVGRARSVLIPFPPSNLVDLLPSKQHRRVKCVRSNGEGEPCDGCVRKGASLPPLCHPQSRADPPTSSFQRSGIQCSMGPVEKCAYSASTGPVKANCPCAATTGRTGKRIETAKQLFGTLPSSSSTALIPSGPETRLANNEMSETFGLELLNLYSNASSSDPLFPPPVFDSYSLKARFEAVCVYHPPSVLIVTILTLIPAAGGSFRRFRRRTRFAFSSSSPSSPSNR